MLNRHARLMHRAPRAACLLVAALFVCAPPALDAQDEAPSVARRLPEQTVAMLRLPDGKAFVDTFKDRTKLGSVLLSDDRLERIGVLIREADAHGWEQFSDGLAEYGLEPGDLVQLLAGDSGLAMLLVPREDDEASAPLAIAVAWVQPGPELAGRAYSAIGKVADDHAEDENPVKRVDMQVRGRRVMHLSFPQISYEFEEIPFEWPDDFDQLDEEQQQRVMDQWEQRWEKGRRQVVTYSNALLSHEDDRLLMAATFEQTEKPVGGADLESLVGVFAGLVEPNDDEATFLSRIESQPGVRAALPQGGVPAMEIFADLAGLMRMAESEPDGARVVKALGLGGLGAVALRMDLDGNSMRMGSFLAAAEPRLGVLALLDQPVVAPTPPTWVPADIVGYSHISTDLGSVYAKIKQMILEEFGDQAQTGFEMAENSVVGFAGADIAAVLSSLGHKHTILTYEPQVEEIENPGGQALSVPVQRVALVWQLKDDAIWTRLLQAVAGFAPMTNGAVTMAEEQGFSGWRFQQGPIEGGLMHGNGYLVFGYGRGVVSTALSALTNPPKGEHALRTSKLYRDSVALIDPEPGLSFQITDGARYTESMHKIIDAIFDMILSQTDGNDDMDMETIEAVRELIPSNEELKNVLGVAAATMVVDENGLAMKSVSELPAPDED